MENFQGSDEDTRLKLLVDEHMRNLRVDDSDGQMRFYKIEKTDVWRRDEKGSLYSQPIEERVYLKTCSTALVTYITSEWQGQRFIKLLW